MQAGDEIWGPRDGIRARSARTRIPLSSSRCISPARLKNVGGSRWEGRRARSVHVATPGGAELQYAVVAFCARSSVKREAVQAGHKIGK